MKVSQFSFLTFCILLSSVFNLHISVTAIATTTQDEGRDEKLQLLEDAEVKGATFVSNADEVTQGEPRILSRRRSRR